MMLLAERAGRKLEPAKKTETCAWFAVLSSDGPVAILRLSIGCIGYFQKPTQLAGLSIVCKSSITFIEIIGAEKIDL